MTNPNGTRLRRAATLFFIAGTVVVLVSWKAAHEGQHDHATASPSWIPTLVMWGAALFLWAMSVIADAAAGRRS